MVHDKKEETKTVGSNEEKKVEELTAEVEKVSIDKKKE